MEFLLVQFPSKRGVRIVNRLLRNELHATTNETAEIEAGVYWITLEGPDDFTPTWKKVSLFATAVNGRKEVTFEPKPV